MSPLFDSFSPRFHPLFWFLHFTNFACQFWLFLLDLFLIFLIFSPISCSFKMCVTLYLFEHPKIVTWKHSPHVHLAVCRQVVPISYDLSIDLQRKAGVCSSACLTVTMSVKYRQCCCVARTMLEMQSSSEGTCEGGSQTYWPCGTRSEGQQILFLHGQSFVYPELGANNPISFEWT